MRRAFGALTCLTLLVGCGGSGEQAVPQASPAVPAVEREFSLALDTLWIVGGASSESAFVDPWYLAAGRERIYVVDPARGLTIVEVNGILRPPAVPSAWPLGPVTVLGDGTVALVSRSDGAIVLADPQGRPRPGGPRPQVRQAQGICALNDRALLIAGGEDRLTMIDRGGGTPVPFPLPWTALRDSAGLLQQTTVASAAGGRECVIALVVGNGFAIVHGEDSVTLHRYVEQIDVPPVRRVAETAADRITTTESLERRVTAATSVAVGDSLIYIAFEGAAPRRTGMIDLYDLGSGAYRASVTLGAPVRAVAASGGVLYVLSVDAGTPALLALRPRRR